MQESCISHPLETRKTGEGRLPYVWAQAGSGKCPSRFCSLYSVRALWEEPHASELCGQEQLTTVRPHEPSSSLTMPPHEGPQVPKTFVLNLKEETNLTPVKQRVCWALCTFL